MRKVRYIKQTDLKDCGVACLLALIKYYGGNISREYLRDITKTTSDGVSVYGLIESANIIGFEAKAVKANISLLKDNLPLIAHILVDSKLGHFVVVTKILEDSIIVMDPAKGFKKISFLEWETMTTNVYLLYKPKTILLKEVEDKRFHKIIFPILKQYKSLFIVIFFFSFLYALSNILLSYKFEFFINLLQENNKQMIHLLFCFLVFVIIFKEFSNLYRNYFLNYLNHKLDKSFVKEVYDHIIRLPYLYFKNRTKGDIVTRIQDVFTIREVISKSFVTLSIDLIFVLFTFIIILKLNIKLGIISIIITFIYSLILIKFNTILTQKMKFVKESEVLVNNHLIESFSSINTIKGMQIEERLSRELSKKYLDYTNSSFHLMKLYYKENFLKELIYGIGLLIILYVGILEVLKGTLNFSTLLVLNSLLLYYFTPIQNICDLQLLFKEANVSFVRIKELLNVPIEKLQVDKKIKNVPIRGNIKIRELMYSYNGIQTVLRCDKLDIKAGDKVLFYGVSGGGKSTLMKLIVRYLDNYDGSLVLDEREIYQYNLLEIRKKITYVSQDEILYTDTLYNNIVFDEMISYSRYLEIIKLTGVDKIFEKSMLKDEMLLDNNASNLSGGEKQRIILARSLVKNSDIYIFDESFSALDRKSERILVKNIFTFLKNKTIIIISHRFNNRDLYQKFILLEKGVVYEY